MKAIKECILVPIYNCVVLLSIGQTDDGIRRTITSQFGKKIGVSEVVGIDSLINGGDGRTVKFGGGNIAVRIRDHITDADMHGLLAHEIFHVTDFILEDVGMELHTKSSEAYAYLLGFITTAIYDILRKSVKDK